MTDRHPPNVSARSRDGISRAKPPWGFWKGLLTGAAVEVPAITLAVWSLARLGIGNPDVPVMRLVRFTTVFAGLAALLTAGGIGRLAADAAMTGGRGRAVYVAARAHAAASIGLVLIAAIPHGELPGHTLGWLGFAAAGLLAGGVCGALIGVMCGGAAPVELADVWSLARRPSEALRSWLDPRELVRLGAAVRHRTTNLFEGMFEPAPPPPPAAPEPQPPAATTTGEPPAPKP